MTPKRKGVPKAQKGREQDMREQDRVQLRKLLLELADGRQVEISSGGRREQLFVEAGG